MHRMSRFLFPLRIGLADHLWQGQRVRARALATAPRLLFLDTVGGADAIATRVAFQLYLIGVIAAYFAAQWLRGGQTLPMKAWKMLSSRAGRRPS